MSDSDGRFVGRREVLAALGAAALGPALGDVGELSDGPRRSASTAPETSDETTEADPTTPPDAVLRVRTYPRLEHSADRWSGWSIPTLSAHGAVGDALDAVATYAEAERDGLDRVDWQLEAGAGVALQGGTDAWTLAEQFRETVRERGRGEGDVCHLLLWSEPLNYEVGYGLALGYAGDEDAAHAVVNVGATERWDGRGVTKNMAIHEALHPFIDDAATEAVIGDECSHNLGTVRRVGDGVAEVTPLATSYAGRSSPIGETTWPGSGCRDLEAFYRHDGLDGVDRWRHTTELSAGTLEAASLYVERELRER
ncbi:hypothetical protein [Natronoarchaeum mannanilyticum]|uniref:Uncharacterized protein n=1 Tax=Natronoarchaeum mannanilyticum TaxID=926360 RepID=A0AAV3T610_9EURY